MSGVMEDQRKVEEQEYPEEGEVVNLKQEEKELLVGDYSDIVIEVDEKVFKFLSSMRIGSLLPLEVLLSLSDRSQCEECREVFYSTSMYEEHVTSLHSVSVKEEKHDEDEETGKFLMTDEREVLGDDDTGDDAAQAGIEENSESSDDQKDEDYLPSKKKVTKNIEKPSTVKKLKKKKAGGRPPLGEVAMTPQEHIRKRTERRRQKMKVENPDLFAKLIACEICGLKYTAQNVNRHKFKAHGVPLPPKVVKARTKKPRCPACLHSKLRCQTCVGKTRPPKEILCPCCGETFTSKHDLSRHKQSVKLRQPVSCEICGKGVFSGTLKTHMLIHDKDRIKNIYCEICGQAFYDRGKLSSHVKVAHADPTIPCSFEGCERMFHMKSLMIRHLSAHNREVVGSCDTCTKTFKNQSAMNHHLTHVHPPERKFLLPHACHICEYRAVHQNSLKVHIQTKHMGVTFDCDRCDYKGSEKGALKRHVLSMHEGVRYQCPLCQFKTGTKHQVKNHIKKMHKDQWNIFAHHDPVIAASVS